MEQAKIIRWMIFAITTALIVIGILFYRFILSYLLVAFLLAYIIAPIIKYAEKYKISRTLSILVVYLIIIGIIILLFSVIIPQIIGQVTDFAKSFSETLEHPEAFGLKSLGLEGISKFIDQVESKFPFLEIEKYKSLAGAKIVNLVNQIPQILVKSISSIINLLAFLVVVPVIGFFILRDERKFFNAFFSFIPNRYFEFLLHLFEKIEENFGKFFRALLLETVLVAVMSILGLLILNIPYALILGIIVGLANSIKYFGPFIGAVPTILVILLGPTPDIYLIYTGIMFVIVQQIDSLILFPWLIGRSINMHPLWVLLTVIAGGYAFGIWGLLFAVPVVFLIKTIIKVSYKSLKDFEII
jgi:predicted PurR-regulated permease PerM